MEFKSRVIVLVKASPQPSKKYQETVCCAGIDDGGKWRRMYPIRFRHLSEDKTFKRWNVVDFDYHRSKTDLRWESCRVHEETLTVQGYVRKLEERSEIVERALVASELEATDKGNSLALIRPTDVELIARPRKSSEIKEIQEAYQAQAKQLSLFDEELAAYQPCPIEFKIRFKDGDGKERKKLCGDWETEAAFFKLRRSYEEREVIAHLHRMYSEEYPRRGITFALGNMQKRPQTWQLLGIFPAKESTQETFDF
ncbi:hypothetical protein [Maritimibacter sp. HL-12]|uniref:hypothetical protein n=1 Tax=Maritimibacter sp. HL-12 TaxID=1162418 RepID=UPI000A0EEF03|nr:hypothetical protein [Maritimibacter sp. HL-12]SMH50032.1 hypothetical protein SAMN05661107_2248 [Maritimibacter sp. HL-12]